MSKDNIMRGLNPQQREALEYSDGPLLVLAGAGSGKTKVITHKYAYLFRSKKISHDNIFTVTFTNKAAGEMRERIGSALGKDVRASWIGTLHSQCGRILRKECGSAGYSTDFSIYDEEDRFHLIRHILKEFRMYEALYRGVASRISSLKAALVGPGEFLSSGDGFGFDEKLAKVYVRYQDELRRSNSLDFDDLVMVTVGILQEHPKILARYQERFSYVLVDEFQDLNHAQYALVKLLAALSGNICAVGDDDQSIYRFRGADAGHILGFEKDFPGAKVVRLEQNYRSTQNILDVANAVIASNTRRREKKLWTDRGCGEKVQFCWLSSEEEEAKHIAKVIKELYLKGAYAHGDVGILYRVNLQSRAIEDALRSEGLPYRVVGGVSFYHRKEIKDLIAYVRLIANQGDNVSFRRTINTPARGIGAATLSKIENEARKRGLCLFEAAKLCIRGNGMVSSAKEKLKGFVEFIEGFPLSSFRDTADLLKAVAERTGYRDLLDEERRHHVDELVSYAEGKNVHGFIDGVSLMTNLDDSCSGGVVSLMTLHNAKGLEFPVVFVSGIEEGLLPYFKAIGNDSEMSEERRLFYVGMTRARDLLLLTGARRRRLYAKLQEQEPSRFLKDVPRQCCKWTEKVSEPVVVRCVEPKVRSEKKPLRPPFSSGCRVKHPVWGIGVVRDCYGDGDDQKVMVNFPNIGLKRLSLKLANLTKI